MHVDIDALQSNGRSILSVDDEGEYNEEDRQE